MWCVEKGTISKNHPILLANLLQSSRRTFSWGSFLSFFAFKEGMLSTPISVRRGWPTVTHEPGLSTAYETRGAIFSRIPHALSCTTTHENKTALRYAGATTSLHSRRGYAGAPCPQESLTRASLQHHHLSPPLGEHAEETCPRS